MCTSRIGSCIRLLSVCSLTFELNIIRECRKLWRVTASVRVCVRVVWSCIEPVRVYDRTGRWADERAYKDLEMSWAPVGQVHATTTLSSIVSGKRAKRYQWDRLLLGYRSCRQVIHCCKILSLRLSVLRSLDFALFMYVREYNKIVQSAWMTSTGDLASVNNIKQHR